MSRMDRPAHPPALDECTPLIADLEPSGAQNPRLLENIDKAQSQLLLRRISYRLYISHFLSTWNSRVFEFGAVLYLASVYPGTLLPMSAYALSRGLAAIIFAPAVGYYIDVGNRLQVVRVSIVLQRLAVVASCVIFYILAIGIPITHTIHIFLLAILTLLACFEKLGSVLNLISVEKDWVVVVSGEDAAGLQTINAQMRRIDLICKLIGPLFIALIDGISTESAILVNFAMNISSVVLEYFSIARVYYEVAELQRPKYTPSKPRKAKTDKRNRFMHIWKRMGVQQARKDFGSYFKHALFLPSFAGALLYLTVLSFAGQMVTWLLSAGYNSTQIAIARTLSVMFEVLATWAAPLLMGRVGPIRAGLWLASWQIACLTGGMAIFWRYASHPLVAASGLVSGTILSRLGLRGFDLCVQILIQEGVEAEARGSFSSTEAAWQNFFEICSYTSTIIFSQPDEFKYPALISVVAVGLAGLLYAAFVRIQRGHILHISIQFSQRFIHRLREWGLENISTVSDF